MDNGWIKLYRKIQDWEWYFDEPFTHTQAWIDMLLIANHQKRSISVRGNLVTVERGQIGHSERTLAQRWHWSRNKVRRFLECLKTKQQIEQQNSNILNVITIINYGQYQQNDTTDGTTERPQTDRNKNDKNVKNINTLDRFDEFWKAYPRKVGKEAARKSWIKISPTNGTFEKILAALRWQINSPDWKKERGQFIPHPSTYLNQGRWEDEPTTVKEPLIL